MMYVGPEVRSDPEQCVAQFVQFSLPDEDRVELEALFEIYLKAP